MGLSPIAGFTRVEVDQASGEANVNEMGNRIETIAALKILDRDLATPPGSPSEGDAYIVASSPTGDWAGWEGKIAVYYNGWIKIDPWGGMVMFVHDEKTWYAYSSQESAWHPMQEIWAATEHWTGRYSVIDGDKIYAKTLNCGGLPSSGSTNTAHGISGLAMDNHFKAQGFAFYSASMLQLPDMNVRLYITTTNLVIAVAQDLSQFTGTRVRIEYTKT
jgi:hypothetical protein